MCDAIAHKFNSVIEYFVFVEEPTQGDDHIFADNTGPLAEAIASWLAERGL